MGIKEFITSNVAYFYILRQSLPLIIYCWFIGSSFYLTLLALYTYFLCRQKVSKSSAHGRFLNAKRSWWFLGVAELSRLVALSAPNPRSDSLCLRRTSAALVASVSKLPLTRLHELSRFSKNHWRRLSKSLMRTNQAILHSMNNNSFFTPLFRALTASVACDFDNAVFF